MFYVSYAWFIPKTKGRVKIMPKLVDAIEVRGILVRCSETEINDYLGCTERCQYDLTENIELNTFDDLIAS